MTNHLSILKNATYNCITYYTGNNIENVENVTNAIFYETIVDEDTYKKIWEEFSNRGIYLHTKSQDYFNIL